MTCVHHQLAPGPFMPTHDTSEKNFRLPQAAKRARLSTAREALYRLKIERSPPLKWSVRALSASAVPSRKSLHHRALIQNSMQTRQSPPTPPDDVHVAKRVRRSIDEEEYARLILGQSQETAERRSPPNIHEYVQSNLLPLSLDPFQALPIKMDEIQEQLVKFYLQIYPRTAYGLSLNMKPSPVSPKFALAVSSPATFHMLLARAALHRLSLKMYTSDEEQHVLEVATLRHKVEALRCLRELSESKHKHDSEVLLAATLSIATLEHRYGSKDSANIHVKAIHRIMVSNGGPTEIKDTFLEQMMWCFECCYLRSSTSFIWELHDFAARLSHLNDFLSRLYRVAHRLQMMSGSLPGSPHMRPSRLPYIRRTSVLHPFLARETTGQASSVYKDISEATAQMTGVLLLAMLFVDLYADAGAVFDYTIQLEGMVRDSELDSSEATLNLVWLMSQGRGLGEADDRKRRWQVAGCLHVIKYLRTEKQLELRNWLLQFLGGETPDRVMRYTNFDFSYAN